MRIEQKLTIPIIIIAIGNALSIAVSTNNINDYLSYSIIFLIPVIILLIKDIHIWKINIKKPNISRAFISIFLLVLSLVSIAINKTPVLNDVFLFSYSIHISKRNKKTYWIYGLLYSILLLSSYVYHSVEASQIMVHLAGVSFILLIYQHYIHPKKHITKVIQKDYLISPVKKEVVDIVHLIIEGCEYHEINDKLELNITADRVRRKVNEEIKRLGFKNREHMIFFLTEKGIIKSISYDLDIKNRSHDIL